MTAFIPPTGTPLASATRTYTTATTHRPSTTPALATRTQSAPIPTSASPSPPAPLSHPTRILVWFHTDLRTVDNPALHAAAQHSALPGGALVPLHAGVAEPHMLAELKAHLEAAGSSLVSATAPVERALIDVCERLKLTAVYFNHSVHKSAVQIETRVQRALSEAGISVQSFWGNSLLPPPQDMSKRTALMALTASAVESGRELSKHLAAPENLPKMPAAVAAIPQRIVNSRVGGGTAAAQRLLATMDKHSEITMTRRTDLAVLLKAHFDAGTISPRMVAGRVFTIFGKLQGRTFSELVWRSYVAFEAHRAVGIRAHSRVAV